jgi:hypothetical protein
VLRFRSRRALLCVRPADSIVDIPITPDLPRNIARWDVARQVPPPSRTTTYCPPTNNKLSPCLDSCSVSRQPLASAGQKNLIFPDETTDNRSGIVWVARIVDSPDAVCVARVVDSPRGVSLAQVLDSPRFAGSP